ncbi:uncharacterized protein LOC121767774 [Salvia splendens]|nr:uncharacterized protein LOC121767774 [Salvia splendens]
MNREESTYAEIQPAPARKLKLPIGRREDSTSTHISRTWTREERDCYQFLLATPYMWTDHVIYSNDVVEVTKLKFSSLKPHEAVDAEVIDVWASHLNGMEVYKSTQKPNRLFVTTVATSDNVVERRASWEKSEAASTFCDEIDGQFNGTGTFDITQHDLTGVADVLDHVVLENGIPDRAKYERDLDLLRDYLGFCLMSKGFDELSYFIITERSTRLLDLPWKTTQATNDSGVFLMRHMETYMGRYCKAMLLASFNDCRERFSSYISHYINVTPNFRTHYARQVNGMLNMAPRNEQHNQPTRNKSKLN